ncbi:MAG: DNA translocase FtsK [Flavobacteriales bacterium TMED191]|nr:MAG: DNA translocase FtsK [Flavobacteriales bacterium TMED191]
MSKYKNSLKLIISLTCITLILSLVLAINSYWSNGLMDQSEIIIKNVNFINTQNTIGSLGAIISEFLIRIFGVSTYFLILLICFVLIKTLFKSKNINLFQITTIHIFLIIWTCLTCSLLTNKIFSGKLGLSMSNTITPFIGKIGTIIFLLLTLLIAIILIFNIQKEHFYKLKQVTIMMLRFWNKKNTNPDNIIKENTSTKTTSTIKKSSVNETQNIAKELTSPGIIIEEIKEEDILNENTGDINKLEKKKIQYNFPNLEILTEYTENKISINEIEVETNKKLIEETLKDFKIDVVVKRATVGPTITLYEIIPDQGVKISKIKNLENDIALRIKAVGVRIIAPLPGKGTVGIEVPNQNPTIVSMKDVIASEKFQNSKFELPIALGKTISNETFVMDLTKMPHLLIAGATGQGKSVGLNAILCSILFKKHPNDVKFILVDPKKVELTLYNKIEKHFLAKLSDNSESIITDTKSVVKTLKSLCLEMDNRYELLKKAEVRNIQEYNIKYKQGKLSNNEDHQFLPYLILVIDEFADLIMTAGKEIEIPIARLAQLSRAIGIHLIIATQRPTTNIITGTIKANFPTRIAFRVIQGIDSKTILDTVGANQLIGRGDMLISTGSSLSRIQCAFIDTPEVEKLTNFIGSQNTQMNSFSLPEEGHKDNIPNEKNTDDRDPLFREAALLIVMHQQGSTSMIQRKLKLGYNRAGRIIDQLEYAGVIGPLEGSKGRKVLVENEEELNQII